MWISHLLLMTLTRLEMTEMWPEYVAQAFFPPQEPSAQRHPRDKLFLIWTNVAMANVAWTNFTVTFGICSGYFQEPTFKVSSKSSQ